MSNRMSPFQKIAATGLTVIALTGVYQYAKLQDWWPDFRPTPAFKNSAGDAKYHPACENSVCRAIVDGMNRPDPEPDHSIHPSPDAYIG